MATALEQPRTVQGRKLASHEARERRRLSRRAKHQHRPASRPHVESIALTDRQRALLSEQAEPLFAEGRIDARYMGVRFLELFSLGWTPVNGFECTDPEFDQVWGFWNDLPAGARAALWELSEGAGMRSYDTRDIS